MNGVPRPKKFWYKKRYNETIELPFTETVKIKNFKSHDEGIYVCEAKNQIGVSQEIKYHVTGRADGMDVIFIVCMIISLLFLFSLLHFFSLNLHDLYTLDFSCTKHFEIESIDCSC